MGVGPQISKFNNSNGFETEMCMRKRKSMAFGHLIMRANRCFNIGDRKGKNFINTEKEAWLRR